MESLSNIRFNHEAEMFYEALGLTERDAEEIKSRVEEVSEATTSISTTIEIIVKEFSGGHLAYALIKVGELVTLTKREESSPASLLRTLLGPSPDCDCPNCRRARGD